MSAPVELLFSSYGTLQQEAVQFANVGRRLQGRPDVAAGHCLSTVDIHNPQAVAESGLVVHRVLMRGDAGGDVDGVIFEITPRKLRAAGG